MNRKRDFIDDSSLVLNAPLSLLDGSSFVSKDAYGHLGTVSGALWRPEGRYLDGVDDRLNWGTNPNNQITNQLTVEIWVQFIAITSAFWIGALHPTAVDYDWGLYHTATETFYVVNASGVDKSVSSISVAVAKNFCHIVGTYDGANLRIFFNGIEEGTPTGQTGNVRNSGYDVNNKWYNRVINCEMGEVRIYNRALTPLEVRHNYLATKWRYQ